MRYRWICAVLIVLGHAPLPAQIYRCQVQTEDQRTTVFSDTPCAEDAIEYQVRRGVSVVGAIDLAQVAEANREFIEARRERLEQARRKAAERRASRQRQQRLQRATEPRYRTVVGHRDNFFFGPPRTPDPRNRNRRRGDNARADEQRPTASRQTLLSRSGGASRPLINPRP